MMVMILAGLYLAIGAGIGIWQLSLIKELVDKVTLKITIIAMVVWTISWMPFVAYGVIKVVRKEARG
jgi:hypothetical protein